MQFKLSSPSFPPNGAIPEAHTCDGADYPPPLKWSGVPDGTKSFALHWVLYDVPSSNTSLGDGGSAAPAGAREGLNDWKRRRYNGPCPPIGRHRYFFKLFALDAMLGDLGSPTKADLEAAMRGHVLAHAELMGTYQRAKVGAK
jgi:Raf kinase inhibitor-like YbhB/YbcL family protein